MPPVRTPVTPVDPAFTHAAGTDTGNLCGPGIHACRRYGHRTSSWVFMRINPKPRCTTPWTNVTVDRIIALQRHSPGPHFWGFNREGLTQTRPAVLPYEGDLRVWVPKSRRPGGSESPRVGVVCVLCCALCAMYTGVVWCPVCGVRCAVLCGVV